MNPGIIQQNGYVWLAQPREGVMPLTLLEKDHENLFKRISQQLFGADESAEALNADIFDLFPKKGRGKYPKISDEKNVAFFKGHDILDLKSGFSVRSTSKIPLIGKLGADAKFELTSKLLYTFKDVKQLVADNEILLEEHLNIAKPNEKAAGFYDKLQNGQLYVVTEVLRVQEFSVKDVSEYKLSGKISADAIKELLKLYAKTNVDQDKKQEVGYKHETPVTFALKAFKVLNRNGKYTLSSKPIKIVKGAHQIEREVLKEDCIDI